MKVKLGEDFPRTRRITCCASYGAFTKVTCSTGFSSTASPVRTGRQASRRLIRLANKFKNNRLDSQLPARKKCLAPNEKMPSVQKLPAPNMRACSFLALTSARSPLGRNAHVAQSPPLLLLIPRQANPQVTAVLYRHSAVYQAPHDHGVDLVRDSLSFACIGMIPRSWGGMEQLDSDRSHR
jgi:hypothetical protein